jgi:hypothetical protein
LFRSWFAKLYLLMTHKHIGNPHRTLAGVMIPVRRSSRLPGMPDAFDRAPLR